MERSIIELHFYTRTSSNPIIIMNQTPKSFPLEGKPHMIKKKKRKEKKKKK